MANYSNPAEYGVKFGNDVINNIEFGDAILGVTNYFYKSENDPERINVRGKIIGNLMFREGTFQVLMVEIPGSTPTAEPKIAFFYLNGNQNCFKPWAESKREVSECLKEEDASAAIRKEVFEKTKGKKIASYKSIYKSFIAA